MSLLDRILGNSESPLQHRSKRTRDDALVAFKKEHELEHETFMQEHLRQAEAAQRARDRAIEDDRKTHADRHDELSREFIADAVPMLRPLIAKFDESGSPAVAREIGATIQQLNARSKDELGGSETMAIHVLVIATLPKDAPIVGALDSSRVTVRAVQVVREAQHGRLSPTILADFVNALHEGQINPRVDPEREKIFRAHGCGSLRDRELKALDEKRRGPRAASHGGGATNADTEITIRRGQPGQPPKSVDQRVYHDAVRSEISREQQRNFEERERADGYEGIDSIDQRPGSGSGVLG